MGDGASSGVMEDVVDEFVSALSHHGNTRYDETVQIDWESLMVCEPRDDQFGSSNPVVDEDGLFALMGLRDDVYGGPSGSAAEGGNPVQDGVSSPNDNDQFEDGLEAPPVTDDIPGETFVQYDKEDPPMTVDFIYGTMEEFRMSLRTHAIKGQFVVVTEKCDRYRFRGYCKAKDDGCPWAIGARVMPDGKSVK